MATLAIVLGSFATGGMAGLLAGNALSGCLGGG